MESRPQILLIGDSIRMGYCEQVRDELSEEAEVLFPSENCRCTAFVIESLASWVAIGDPERIAAVHFNSGHWDAESFLGDGQPLTPHDVYARNIGRIFAYLKHRLPNAKLSFATTTPMNPTMTDGVLRRTTNDIIEYNRVGVIAAREAGAEIDDLFAVTTGWSSDSFVDYCHFTPESNALLGRVVADFLRGQLGITKA